MKKIAIYIIGMLLGTFTMFTGCDVHEWPKEAESVAFNLRLNFDAEMTSRDYYHEIEASRANSAEYDFRYVLRAYPILPDGTVSSDYRKEFVCIPIKDCIEEILLYYYATQLV